MKEFQLRKGIDKKMIFLVNSSEIEGRLDPYFNYHIRNTNLKSKFPTKPLYKLSKPFSGGTPSKDKPEYWNGSIPWVSSKDVKDLYLTNYSDTITEKGLQNSSAKLVPANSIIMVVRSGILIHTLPISITTFPVTINQDLKAFVVNDEDLLPEYLGIYFYVFENKLLPLIKKHSTTVQSINTEQFSKLDIPIPPKHIQESIIEKINCGVENKQAKLTQSQTLLDSIDDYLLKELGITLPEKDNSLESRMFKTNFSKVSGRRFDPDYSSLYYQEIIKSVKKSNYLVATIEDFVFSIHSGKTPSSSEYTNEKNDFPIVKVGSYTGDEINLAKVDYATKEQPYEIKKNDIFILSAAHQAEYVGKHIKMLLDIPKNKTSFVGELIKISSNPEKCNHQYLFSLLNLNIFKTLINREKQGKRHIFTQRTLKKYKYLYPQSKSKMKLRRK